MTEAVTINNEELAILCDIVSGWGVKKWAENPDTAKKQALDRLIAHGIRPISTRKLPLQDINIQSRQRFFSPSFASE
jgi:hypothetical protein